MLKILHKLDKNITLLGIISMLNDIASEMVFSVLPIFMSTVLMLDKSVIGLIEGVAESASSVFKIVSGKITGKNKKPVILFGYSLSTLCKPMFAVANSWWMLLLVRTADRAGKGIRSPPRDTLIADYTEKKLRGEAFGFHRMMDTMGAVIGPLIAFVLLGYFALSYQQMFLLAVIPGLLSVGVLHFFVKEHEGKKQKESEKGWVENPTLEKNNSKWFVLGASVFALGNFSFAFVLIRANELGVGVEYVPLAYLLFNLMYAVFSIPFGEFADRIGSKLALKIAYLVFGVAFVGLGFASEIWQIVLLVCLYGAATAGFETIQRAVGSKLVSREKRAGLFGNYQGLSGLMALPASLIAGVLWQVFGATFAFAFSGVTSVVAILILGNMKHRKN